MKMKILGWLVAAVLASIPLQNASATLLTMGESVTFNYNFTGQTPPPTYSSVDVYFPFSGFDVGEVLTVAIFADPDAAGTKIYKVKFHGDLAAFTFGGSSGTTDGLFSAVVSSVSGSFGVTSAAKGFEGPGPAQGATASVAGIRVSAPEPATLPMLGLGLAGLAVLCRRKAQTRLA
jgi:hypothetical protein